MTEPKDSAEVAKFMSLFSRLKDWCDDDPESLPVFAKQDESIKELCDQLFWTAHDLKKNERRRRQLFAAPVDSKFLAVWRDFEERFERVLSDIYLADILLMLDDEPKQSSQAELQRKSADYDAAEQANAIEVAIDFAYQQGTDDDRGFPEGFSEDIEDGVAAWERLKDDAGFDLRGVFRRREVIPFVLVPKHVAARYGDAEQISIYNNLQQAHDAFIFGAPFAALALMRSIMEAVLREHYGAQGKKLSERIRDVRMRLPDGANEAALHRLRKLANAILHLDAEKDEDLPKIEATQMEKEIVSLLFVLRALIEGAPRWPSR